MRLYLTTTRLWRIATLAVAALSMASCQRSEFEPTAAADNDTVEFRFSKPAATRAQIGDDGSGAFDEGDCVGLFVGTNPARYYRLTLQNGAWIPAIPRRELGNGSVTLNACYPAPSDAEAEAAAAAGALSHPIAADQRTEGFAAADRLWCHRTFDPDAAGSARVEMTFAHAMHRLEIVVADASGTLPADLQVAVRSAAQTSIDFASGTSDADASTLGWITPAADASRAGRYVAVVAPQPLAELQSDEGWIRITAGGKTACYAAPDQLGGAASLNPGMESLLTLNLRAQTPEPEPEPEPDIDWANRKVWVYGVTSPVFDAEKAPVYTIPPENITPGEWYVERLVWSDGSSDEYYYLPWVEGCGWYDCNKTYAWDNAEDYYMCWAASSSNILHWWLEHNAAYVDAYDLKYGQTEYHKKYPRPSALFRPYPARSEIFDLFIDSFNNRGAGEGVHWFINGSPGHGTSGIDNPAMLDFKGYFNEVFPITEELYSYNPRMGRENFNRVLKDALQHRKAIAFVTNGNHDMTIWGAEFDEEGYASYIYYVDNNPRGDPDPAGAVCIRMEVTYRPSSSMGLQDQTYLGDNESKLIISSLGIVDLQRDLWQKAFPEVVLPAEER